MHTTSVLLKNRQQANSAHLDLSNFLGYKCNLQITAWNESFDAFSYLENETECLNYSDIGLDSVLGLINAVPVEASVQDWFNTIPPELIKAVSELPSYRLGLLKACHSSRHARELLLTMPLLAWMLLHYIDTSEMHFFPINMFSMKPRDILSEIGLVGDKSSVKQLRKLCINSNDISHISSVLHVFKYPKLVQAFRHFDVINISTLKVLEKHHWLANTPLLTVFNRIENAVQLKESLLLLNDSLNMTTQLRIVDRKTIAGCKSLEQLKNVHDSLALRINLAGIKKRMLLHDENGVVIPIPAPPITGNETIEAIATVEALAKEGATMHHCVASYINRIQLGKYYVYHISEPENATIGLTITGTGLVTIDQIKCVANKKPTEDTVLKVEKWLESHLYQTTRNE